MTVQDYDLATLVPKGLYAAQAREMLVAARTAIAAMSVELDAELRSIALSQGLAPVYLFKLLRVILAWPEATPDLFETIEDLGRDEVIARLDQSIMRLGDVA